MFECNTSAEFLTASGWSVDETVLRSQNLVERSEAHNPTFRHALTHDIKFAVGAGLNWKPTSFCRLKTRLRALVSHDVEEER